VLDRGTGFGQASNVGKGGYVYADSDGKAEVLIIATGSEVQFAVEARRILQDSGIPTRVVSMPCVEWFKAQPKEYQDEVLPPTVTKRISIEAGLTSGWREFVGDRGVSLGIDEYGASADYQTLFAKFGINAASIVNVAKQLAGKN
jgi:transketolase